MNFYITGTRRGLGEALACKYGNIDSLEHCDVFINCKHDEYKQVELLYQASELGKRIINIGSNSPGYFDSPRVANVEDKKMSIEYCVEVIDWILQQPHRVKDITVVPD